MKILEIVEPYIPLAHVSISDIVNALRAEPDLEDVFAANFHYNQEDVERELGKFQTDPWWRQRVEQVRQLLTRWSSRNFIHVYRGFRTVPDLSQPLGPHWSLDREVAADVGGEILADGIVSAASVNWTATLARALYWWDDERELTLRRGTSFSVSLNGQRAGRVVV